VPASPYAAAKLAVGSFARMLHALHGLQVVHLRVFMLYGPGAAQPHEARALRRHLASASGAAEAVDWSRPVDWVYVDDVVDAFIAASSREVSPAPRWTSARESSSR
jgi:UDP-glucose 4-epimerase